MERNWGLTDAGHNMSMPLYLNVDVPEQNYQGKADAACVTDFHDCMESPGCILSDELHVIQLTVDTVDMSALSEVISKLFVPTNFIINVLHFLHFPKCRFPPLS